MSCTHIHALLQCPPPSPSPQCATKLRTLSASYRMMRDWERQERRPRAPEINMLATHLKRLMADTVSACLSQGCHPVCSGCIVQTLQTYTHWCFGKASVSFDQLHWNDPIQYCGLWTVQLSGYESSKCCGPSKLLLWGLCKLGSTISPAYYLLVSSPTLVVCKLHKMHHVWLVVGRWL